MNKPMRIAFPLCKTKGDEEEEEEETEETTTIITTTFMFEVDIDHLIKHGYTSFVFFALVHCIETTRDNIEERIECLEYRSIHRCRQ
jgi:hypothetical protein